MRGFLLLLLWVLVLGQGAVLYWGYEREQTLSAELDSLHQEVASLRQELTEQRNTLAVMEQQSVSTMVSKANKVIVEGWDAIINSVESELGRARAALSELERETPTKSQNPSAP